MVNTNIHRILGPAASALFAGSQFDFYIILKTEWLGPSHDVIEIARKSKNAWADWEALVCGREALQHRPVSLKFIQITEKRPDKQLSLRKENKKYLLGESKAFLIILTVLVVV